MKILTVKQVAARWGCTVQAVYDRISRGTLAVVHIGSLKVVTLAQVEQVEALRKKLPVQK